MYTDRDRAPGVVDKAAVRRLRPEGEVNAVREGRELAAVLVD